MSKSRAVYERFLIYKNSAPDFSAFQFNDFFLIGVNVRDKNKPPIETGQNALYLILSFFLGEPIKSKEN